MHKISIILVLIVCFFSAFGQNSTIYHRAKVSLIDKDINTLARLGIETDHGKHAPKRFLESDFSEDEIALIKNAGFSVEVTIPDVISYYQNPNRPSELDNVYSRSGNCNQTTSCQIGDYPVPTNYSGGSMGGYKTYSELLAALDSMVMLYPNLISQRTNISEDTTYNGHNLFYLKISDNPNDEEVDEPQVLYTALHHAREPNSLSQMLYYMWYVLENYETDPEIKNIVENTEMYFVPCINPDGYIINEINFPDGGGLWRKNAWVSEDMQLTGVDLNRNYGYFWGFDNSGSSPNPNSETFRGDSAFSEPETKIIKQFCEAKNFLIALNYHSHGDLLIYPWGYSDSPTDEDVIFQGLGSEMIHENCFTTGTGTETVGYVVNGDSDDWMYGETTTKNKIYSMTPEVGPSFWPPQQDIISLNQSCMAMNIRAAQLTLNLYEIKNNTKGPIFNSDDQFEIAFTKVGLGEGAVDVSISAVSNNIESIDVLTTIDVAPGEEETVPFPFTYSPTVTDGDIIEIKVEVRGKGYTKEEYYSFVYYENDKETILSDVTEDSEAWESIGDWGLTDEYVNAGSFSLADSPNAEYRRNATTRTILKEQIDLSQAIYAEIQYDARWEIETDYDFAMVLASTDGLNFTPLCGNYTNEGTNNQVEGEPLYDGFQKEWIEETISLIDYIGEPTVYIQFSMTSDQFVEEEGIYIDDIRVNQITETISSDTDISTSSFSIFPNPAFNTLQIKSESNSNYQLSIKKVTGEVIFKGGNVRSIDISSFAPGVYIAEMKVQNKVLPLKFIKT